MKKVSVLLVCVAVILTACSKKNEQSAEPTCCDHDKKVCVEFAAPVGETVEIEVPAEGTCPAYTIVENPQVDMGELPVDEWICLFDGKTFNGWRGYLKKEVPGRWIIEDGAIKFNGTGRGEAQVEDGGDIIFAHKFKNFELSFDWKVAKGSNSGVFVLAQEIKDEPIYISAPEYQILDNENHPDATQGIDGNRQSASLYDMIAAKPQNAKPFGEWNTGGIKVYKGSVFHYQNGETVAEYHLWTPQWTEMLQASKFSEEAWPLAFHLLNNLGGANGEGYIGLQDHGDDVWYKNIKIKILE